MDLSIIIVNYNTLELTRNCIRSIYNNTLGITYEIILIDNASSDGSPELFKKEFPNANFISNKKNLGFALANNQGIEIAQADNILLLNSDTLVIGDCLNKVLDFSKQTPDAGIIGCKVLNKDGSLQYSSFNEPTLISETIFFTKSIIKNFWDPVTYYRYMKYWNHAEIRQVDSISGCFFWVKKDLFKKIGLLDEKIFMYYEDSEFCKRTKLKSDYKIYYFPFAQITHFGGASAPGEQKNNSIINCFKAAQYYFTKCYGDKQSQYFTNLCRMTWKVEKFLFSLIRGIPVIKKKYFLLNELIKN